MSAPTWDEEFALPDGSYSISDIQDYFVYILKKHGEKTDIIKKNGETTNKSPIHIQIYTFRYTHIYTHTFKIKNEYSI